LKIAQRFSAGSTGKTIPPSPVRDERFLLTTTTFSALPDGTFHFAANGNPALKGWAIFGCVSAVVGHRPTLQDFAPSAFASSYGATRLVLPKGKYRSNTGEMPSGIRKTRSGVVGTPAGFLDNHTKVV
jgi:hypothetical protein